ncbi:MAG: caspase family protein [Elusimicrobiota bacterium]|nr:MAG: caspase family protein [Elusimicrobiota bacterium]
MGVEKYRSAGVPVVDYAARDARTVAAYLARMGYDLRNVAVLTDAEAGKVDFDKHFGPWLKNRVGPKSRVFVYYAGHGAPNPTTGEGFLMPYEADPAYLDESAYPVARLYAALAKLPTKDVTVVLDACFSGQGERSLIAKGTRPLVAVMKTPGPANAAVLAAASGSQVSASDHEARHGLLTYQLLAGLHGAADADGDGRITTKEAFAYARPAVERTAKLQNVEQTPTITGEETPAGARVWLTVDKPRK